MKIRIAHSPDSDDAFMFYGLASGKVPSQGFELEHVLSDIETLNRAAFDGKYEITAVSFHAYAHLTDRYILLPHGASMGDRYGPSSSRGRTARRRSKGVSVAIPGELTTAFLALRLFDPTVEYVVMPFDQIQEKVHAATVAAGLLIHEGQLTYADEGLKKIVDLGEWWADRTGGLPLPLGGNVIRRDLGAADDRDALAPAARQHRVRARPSRRGGGLRDAVRPRSRPARTDRVRRHVRERSDARLRRPWPRQPCIRLLGDAERAGLMPSRSTSSSRPEAGVNLPDPP